MTASISDFKEVLQLLPNERPDLRKEVLKVMNQYLQHPEVVDWFVENGSEQVALLTEMLQPGKVAQSYIANVLLCLINLADKGACSRAMLSARAVPRTMLLLEKGALSPALQELCLILLANLTSVSVDAVESLLQSDNKTLEGYYLSQVIRRFVDEHVDKKDLILSPSEEDGAVGGGRDRSKWVGHILANCAQCATGRRLLVEDDVSVEKFVDLLSSPDTQLRLAVTCILKNVLHDPETHQRLIELGAAGGIIARLVGGLEDDIESRKPHETNEDILNVLAAATRCLQVSKPGSAFMDDCGAKKKLQQVLELLPDNSSARTDVEHVITQLDDVQDVHVVEQPTQAELRAAKEKKEKAERRERRRLPAESGVEVLDDSDDEEQGEKVELPEGPEDEETAAAVDEMHELN